MNFQIIQKIILTSICVFGLFWQTFILFTNYMSGKTVTKITFERIIEESIPGITICLPLIISMEKVSHFDKFTMKIYKKFMFITKHNSSNKEALKEIYYDTL